MKFHQFKIRFVENKKIFFGISIAVLLIGVIFNVIFGARLDKMCIRDSIRSL